MRASRRESLRVRLVPARSIEETGLDPSLYGSFLSPEASTSPHVLAMMKDRNDYGPLTSSNVNIKQNHTEEKRIVNASNSGDKKGWNVHKEPNSGDRHTSASAYDDVSDKLHGNMDTGLKPILEEKEDGDKVFLVDGEEHLDAILNSNRKSLFVDGKRVSEDARSNFDTDHVLKDSHNTSSSQSLNASLLELNKAEKSCKNLRQSKYSNSHIHGEYLIPNISTEDELSSDQRKTAVRNRWKRVVHSIKFVNHMTASISCPSTVEEMLHHVQDDAGGVGAATFEGAKTAARSRCKGRKGMEGLLVRQDRNLITSFQDFYVTYLKMPIGSFLLAVFIAPLALGLVFTPFYLLDVDGLTFNGVVPEDATTSPLVSAKQRCLAFLNIFLYALSLSTTFGGAPVAARSPFCLLVANMNTLMAQFLFVFLSGAVFARMSQPSYPLRCSKKAIIKTDDLFHVLGVEHQKKYKAFSVRLVLTGPSPCELVDVKICLTFRIFITLPSGYVFCSTQDLEVMRAEVPYLRYGLMVRHVINERSPVYNHTMDSLKQGDASFSLTVMGLERTSMQPVFHVEDYFVCDDDVVWEGDYEDFIHTNAEGKRVLDHSRIDDLKSMKGAVRVSQAISRMKNLSHQEKEGKLEEVGVQVDSNRGDVDKETHNPSWPRKWLTMPKQRLLKSKSTSFTRADW